MGGAERPLLTRMVWTDQHSRPGDRASVHRQEPCGQQGPLMGRTQPGDVLQDPRPALLRPPRAPHEEQWTQGPGPEGPKPRDNGNPVGSGRGPGTERGSLLKEGTGPPVTARPCSVSGGPTRGPGSSVLCGSSAHDCSRRRATSKVGGFCPLRGAAPLNSWVQDRQGFTWGTGVPPGRTPCPARVAG